nr:MAG TPA: ubiquitin-like protein [Caudoviricetes sp.]
MVKIKRKVEMTLPELIQWGWKNHITEKAFYSNLDGGSVYFDNLQNVSTEHEIAINETFTVEVKEEITEDTIIPLLLKIYKSGDNASEASIYRSISINTAESSTRSIAYYSINDGGTLTLIWKDGELAGDE